jgi:4-hydroxy-tetrahydrodipicolinate reductase
VKVAVVGHGHMGREVEAVLHERGHEAVVVGRGVPYPAGVPVGIDFTRPDAVLANIRAALAAQSRYVVGTTGWTDHLAEVKALVDEQQGGLVHAANFSVGVNLFYRVVREAASLLSRFPDYDPYVVERHHRQKKDAPSGTARVLAEILEKAAGPRARAISDLGGGAIPSDAFHVASVRAGGIVGEHVVGFDSGVDELLLEHRARSRRGFALGSVLAAEWIVDRRGLYAFADVLDDSLSRR